ncbi:hypothetical protein PsorP6_010401 [Peronosclerospora sorghi]|uniref:Uncharacterized protein n=1 Tax=Peronosclerospora sorghi TaxID=230839 RepID=A0ACC0VVI7_9STRA|nr:hypothetical protein PsorP6_010401 [Peronosclerospora sorghi]
MDVVDADGPPLALSSASSSPVASSTRKVRLSDRQLWHRVHQVAVPPAPVPLERLSSKRGWKRIRRGVPSRMRMYSRVVRDAAEPCQVVVGGELGAPCAELVALLRASTESESNALLRAVYGSQFIYSSLLHAIPTTERPLSGPQLMVRTATFAQRGLVFRPCQQQATPRGVSSLGRAQSFHAPPPRLSSPHRQGKNEQFCYIERLSRVSQGFQLAFCSLDTDDVCAGKAPAECVIPLHPITGWLVAVPSPRDPASLEFTFQATFRGHVPGNCHGKTALHRLTCLAKGVCRMDKILRQRRRYLPQPTASKRLWHVVTHAFRGERDDDATHGRHRNWHCIACTRSLVPTWRKTWRRCDLCAYRVCDKAPCCAHERVAIYNRYVAPLVVCARCRECMDDRASAQCTHGRESTGDDEVRYTGVSLRFAERDVELEAAEREPGRDPLKSGRKKGAGARPLRKRRAHSDPPPHLSVAFSSSEDEM